MRPQIPTQTEILVIGGGVAGLSAARLLAEGGAQVVLAEAGAIGAGASGRGHGQALLGLIEHPCRVIDALGEAHGEIVYALGGASRALLADWGVLEPAGGWWIALDDREPALLERSAEALARLGLRAELHAAEATAARSGIDAAGPGLFLPDEGLVDPPRALAQLARLARAAGAIVLEQTRIRGIADHAGALVAHTDDGRLSAEIVVYAGGVGLLELEPFFTGKLVPVREQALQTSAGSGARTAGRAGHGYTWWRDADALQVGGCRWATPHLEVGEREPVPVDAVQRRLEAFLGRTKGARDVAHRRAWIEAHSCDGLPVIGPLPGAARHVACAGFCGNDWGLAPGAAAAVAAGLLGEETATAPKIFAATRFL